MKGRKKKTTHEWLDQLKKDLFREHQIGSNNWIKEFGSLGETVQSYLSDNLLSKNFVIYGLYFILSLVL